MLNHKGYTGHVFDNQANIFHGEVLESQNRTSRQRLYALNVELVFEWDTEKDSSNQKKHGVSFAEASEAFFDPFNLVIADPDHSLDETRSLLLGFAKGTILIVSFAERRDAVRIISCRKANTRERRMYEQIR